MKRRQFLKSTAAAGIITVLTPSGIIYSCRRDSNGAIEKSFRTPPASARPFTWWHWMNGNVTKEGITLDLEAMAEVGVGGFQAFSVSSGIPAGPAEYLSPLWIDLMHHAASEAGRLGLEFDLHNCMGWSSTGGSWITPELSMQQVVWTEAYVEGGKSVNIQLPQPFKRLDYYGDSVVLAFPTIDNDPAKEQIKKITLNGQLLDFETINGFDLSSGIDAIPKSASSPSYLLFEFEKPVKVRSVTVNSSVIRVPDNGISNTGNTITFEASEDGHAYKQVTELSQPGNNQELPSIAGFPATEAKYFRLKIPMARKILNVRLSGSQSINDWLSKANYYNTGRYNPDIELVSTEIDGEISEAAINPETVIDISEHMNKQGQVIWDAPSGHWTIVRFGHTTTGVTNHPAEGKGLGLECDKYSQEAFDFHFNYMLDNLLPALKPLADNGKLGMLIDSYEVNVQNWTKQMPQEFTKRMGYDLLKYLPVLTGRAVGSVNTTERFLWDFRRTCADLMSDNYQGRFTELCKEHNIISYTEPYNRGPFEEMQAGSKMDINMGEFWMKSSHFCHSIKVASSIQNMNGRQIVGAESFTGRPYHSRWQEYPFSMKAQGDFMYTRGLNRFIFHRYAQQPHPTALPGMTMGQWGFHFDRTNTWFFKGKKWLEYVARCQYVLQQGVFAGDVMCFTGEEAPGDDISMGALLPDLPFGYDFQFANSDILLNRIKIKDSHILLPDGMSFSLLVLPDKKIMTIEVARKLHELVNNGMMLLGRRPESIPSLRNYSDAAMEFRKISEELWGPEGSSSNERKVGKGRIFSGLSISEVLNKIAIKPDFQFSSKSGDAPINYIHRKIEDNDVYFVANRRRFSEELVCSFRVSGKEPELWDADSGEIIPVNLFESSDGVTRLPLQLEPGGSVFVLFRKAYSDKQLISIAKDGESIIDTDGFSVTKNEFNRQTINDFTVSLWVKPETEDLLPSDLGEAPASSRPLSSYPVDPPPGKLLFGEGHASFCLLVARNGVVVYEKENSIPSAVIIAPMPISSWTHFTVVYQGGVPTLYVNGKFVKKGVKSEKLLHPVIGETYKNEYLYYYDGDLSVPQVFDTPISAEQVLELEEKGRPETGNSVPAEFVSSNTPALRIWQNGIYTFRESTGDGSTLEISEIDNPVELIGEWTASFPKGLGAPEQIVLPQLSSLHTHDIEGVKYFSGTATYNKRFSVEPSLLADEKRVFLDLGRIAVIAEVVVNGKDLGIVWKPPYRFDITDAVTTGDNELQVKVTNLWPNRLIGDEQLPVENEYNMYGINGAAILKLPEWYQQGKPKPAGGRITFSTWQHFTKDAPLLESGLIGPVVIRNAVVKPI